MPIYTITVWFNVLERRGILLMEFGHCMCTGVGEPCLDCTHSSCKDPSKSLPKKWFFEFFALWLCSFGGRRSGSICWFDVPCNPACILPWGLTICFPTFWNLAERLNSTPTQKQAVSVLRLGSTRILPNVFACVSLFSIWLCTLWETNKETYKYLWWHKRPNMLNGKR